MLTAHLLNNIAQNEPIAVHIVHHQNFCRLFTSRFLCHTRLLPVIYLVTIPLSGRGAQRPVPEEALEKSRYLVKKLFYNF